MRPVTPLLTVDAIIELPDDRIVLVERRYPPPGWALPGGFVDPGESLARAVRREALEETGLVLTDLELFHVYSVPWRDPRGDTVSVVYRGRAEGTPRGGDDAASAVPFSVERLPVSMAFDHGEILRQYLHWRRTGERPSPEL